MSIIWDPESTPSSSGPQIGDSGYRAGVTLTEAERETLDRVAYAVDGKTNPALFAAVESLIAARVDAALAEVEQRVDAQYRAYLDSSGLSADWIAGWHASNLHAAHHVRAYRQEQARD